MDLNFNRSISLLVGVIALTTLTILPSCGSEIKYEVSFENTTSYKLDSLRVGVMDDTILTIPAHGRSGPFTVSRIDNLASYFSQPGFSLTVLAYSDSNTVYKNRIGRVFAFEDLEERKLNTVFVLLDTSNYYSSCKFWFSPNKDGE